MSTTTVISRPFGQENPNWSSEQVYNELFLKSILGHMNNVLSVRGHVLLNDVYDALGMSRTSQGCVEGWLFGNGSVDFAISGGESVGEHILHFTTQGNIVDAIGDGS